MSRGSKISLSGLYMWDNSLFDGFQLPEGITDEKDNLIQMLLMETSSQEVIYPEPETMKRAISAWSSVEVARWSRIYETTVYEYDPFENYNMTTHEERTRTPNLTQTSQNSGTDTSVSYVQPFNDVGTMTQNGKAEATLGTKNTINNTGTEKEVYDKTEVGDASVRSAAQVIKEMRDERLFDIFRLIIDEFCRQFIVGVYV